MRPPPQNQPPAADQVLTGTHLALYRRLATFFILLTAAVACLAVYVVFARATVVVLSKQEEIKGDFLVDAVHQPVSGEIAGGFYDVMQEVTRNFPTESQSQTDVPVEGTVRISSRLDRPQTLVATTRLLTPAGVMFRLKRTVTVPADGSIETEVYADQPGAASAVGTAVFTIPGLNPDTRLKFTVETVEPLAGGVKDVRAVTDTDVQNAVAALKTQLQADLADKLKQQAQTDGVPTSGEMPPTVEVVDLRTDVPIGSDAPEFSLTVKLHLTTVFYDAVGLKKLIEERLTELLPSGRQLVKVTDEATTVAVEKTDAAGDRVSLRVAAKGITTLAPNSPALDPARLVGVTTQAAVDYLEKLDGVASASVKVRPFWAGRLPDIPGNIKVEVR